MSKQFIALGFDIFNDLGEGKLTPNEFLVLGLLYKQAVYKTGIWYGHVGKLSEGCNYQLSEDTITRAVNSLAKKEYIRSFHLKGKTGKYHIALHGYTIKSGDLNGHVLDARSTTDPQNPSYINPQQQEAKLQESLLHQFAL